MTSGTTLMELVFAKKLSKYFFHFARPYFLEECYYKYSEKRAFELLPYFSVRDLKKCSFGQVVDFTKISFSENYSRKL